MSQIQSRRDFLSRVAGIAASTVIASSAFSDSKLPEIHEKWHLNAAFNLKSVDTDKIVISTTKNYTEEVSYTFQGFEADLLTCIDQEADLSHTVEMLGQKYRFSNELCQKKVMDYLQEYQKFGLVYTGDLMLVKIVERTHD